MTEKCPCLSRFTLPQGLKSGQVIRKGYYFRSSDCKTIQRYYCRACRRGFSRATFSPAYWQKKRFINPRVFHQLCSGTSIRRTAKILGIDRRTVARKLKFLAQLERSRSDRTILKALGNRPVSQVYFDEVETSHHTKLKPLSIPLLVSPERVILGFDVAIMPAKGHLAALSRKKYGVRPDGRQKALKGVLKSVRPFLSSEVAFSSDECPRYPSVLKMLYPEAPHCTTPGRRGAVVGQGELKKIGFDPLFALNHTAAMLRANVNRLFRKTWCTTKQIDRLKDHLTLYAAYHNRYLVLAHKPRLQPKLLTPGADK